MPINQSDRLSMPAAAPRTRRLRWLGLAAASILVVALLLSGGPGFSIGEPIEFPDDPFRPGGPWRAVTQQPACASLGKVCAEWPMLGGNLLCCVEGSAVGTYISPVEVCGGDLLADRF